MTSKVADSVRLDDLPDDMRVLIYDFVMQTVDERGHTTDTAIDLGRFRSDQGVGEPISLAIRDAYAADEPFVLEAAPSAYRQTLNGTVERLDAPATVRNLVLRPRGDVHRAEVSLPPGLYRASVKGQGLVQVEDIFLVLGPGGEA